MDSQGTQIELTVVGASALWSLGFALLAWSTHMHGFDPARWGLFFTAAAVTWSIMIGMRWSRRRLQRVLRYELQVLRDERAAEREDLLDRPRGLERVL